MSEVVKMGELQRGLRKQGLKHNRCRKSAKIFDSVAKESKKTRIETILQSLAHFYTL